MELEMIPCLACGKPMPKLRLEKYGYKVCVECSQVGQYKAITTVNGDKDDTWNDIQFVSEEEFVEYNKNRENNGGKSETPKQGDDPSSNVPDKE